MEIELKTLTVTAVVTALILAGVSRADEVAAEPGRRIAVWGSSVANGTGDELAQGGYAGRLATLLQSRGWEVVNLSRNGDNTITIAPRFDAGGSPQPDTEYLTDAAPDYVLIGLSLGNEGIAQCLPGQTQRCTSSITDAEAIADQFAAGLASLIRQARAAGITPVVALPYARSDFWEREYAITRQMVLLINSWDVPSINMLGAVDDGYGRWARGLWAEPFHPNAAGHAELAYAIVPTVFAALEAGKPVPVKAASNAFARVAGGIAAPLAYDVGDTMHSFTLSFMVRPGSDGVVAAVSGKLLGARYSKFRRSYGDFSWDTENVEFEPSGDRFTATIESEAGTLLYTSSSGSSIRSSVLQAGRWHNVTLTHYLARGETLFYVNGQRAGTVAERLQPERFVLGGPGDRAGAARADYKEWMIHRSASTDDEVAALHAGRLLKASLEVYVPVPAAASGELINRAQSLAEIAVDPSVQVFTDQPGPAP